MASQGYFSQLPTWAKGVVAVIGIATIAGVGFVLYRTIKKTVEGIKEGKEERDFQKETQQELDVLLETGQQPTLSDSQAISLANMVEASLSGCELSGTEELVSKEILAKVNNQADWLKLQKTFGIRNIDNCGVWTGDTKQDLKGVLMSDLDGFDWSFTLYSTVLRKGLEKKGITW